MGQHYNMLSRRGVSIRDGEAEAGGGGGTLFRKIERGGGGVGEGKFRLV